MKKVKPLFPLKDCNLHPSSKIYQGKCSSGEIYIGDTICNVEKRSSKRNSTENILEPTKDLAD